jgi:hypothetical protein
MDLNKLKTEDFTKKSNINLLKLIEQLDVENITCNKEIEKLLDKQDEIFNIYNQIMTILGNRGNNQ